MHHAFISAGAVQSLGLAILAYIAAGAVLFAHPTSHATPADFTPRGQLAVFLDTLPAVLGWPLALWHILRRGF